jgi:predicted DNA-binding transcriptional regulator YafY
MFWLITRSLEECVAKADNLLALLWLLRSRGRLSASQVATELKISERTVYRYIDALCASGAPIASEGGPGGGYLLLETFREPPVFFDSEERTALLHASMFADQAGYPFSDALERALRKIELRMNTDQLKELARHATAFGVVSERDTPHFSVSSFTELLRKVENAASENCVLTIKYSSVKRGHLVKRTIEPYGLVYWRDLWYLVAFCRLRHGIKIFRVDRVSAISECTEHFERPEGLLASEWFAHQIIPNASKKGSVVVRIKGEPAAIDHLSRRWYLRRLVTEQTSSEIKLTVSREAAFEHLPQALLSYGTSIRIAAPPWLAARVVGMAVKVAEFHTSFENH